MAGDPALRQLTYAPELVLKPRFSLHDLAVLLWAAFFVAAAAATFPLLGILWFSGLCAGCGLLCVALVAIRFLPGRVYLRLGHDGIGIGSLFGATTHRWDNIREVRVAGSHRSYVRHVAVYCVLRPGHQDLNRQQRRKLERRHPHRGDDDHDELIDPRDYGMTAQALLRLIEQWRPKQTTPPHFTGQPPDPRV